MRLGFSVVEGDLPFFVVQVDPHAPGHEAEGELLFWLAAGVEFVRAAPQHPVALLWHHGELPVPLRVSGGHAHAPVTVIGYVHLPVMAAAAEALPAEHTGPFVEALGALRLL